MAANNTKAFSDTFIRSLKPSGAVDYYHDKNLTGLFVEVKPNGTKIFKAKVTSGPMRNKKKSIGKFGDIDVASARALAEDFLTQSRSGIDVAEAAKIEALKKGRRLSDCFADYMLKVYRRYGTNLDEPISRWKPPTVAEKKRATERLVRELEDPLMSELTYDLFEEWMDRYKGGPQVAANRILAAVRPAFTYEVHRGMLRKDPTSGIEKFPEKRNMHALEGKEIGEMFLALGRLRRGESRHPKPKLYAGLREIRSTCAIDCIELTLRTGQRPQEIRTLLWEDDGVGNYIDMENNSIVLREHKTAHQYEETGQRVALPPNAKELVMTMARTSANRYMFPGQRGDGPITYKTLLQALKRVKREMENCDPKRIDITTLYTMRHSFATLAAREGWSISDIAKQLKHKSVQTTMRYIHYAEEYREKIGQKADDMFASIMSPSRDGDRSDQTEPEPPLRSTDEATPAD